MIGGAALTVTESSGRDKGENEGRADMKNKGVLKNSKRGKCT